LAMKVRDSIDRLHQAVNQIRNLRSQLKTLQKWAGDSASGSVITNIAERIDLQMSAIEAELVQVKMKSSEGNLRYPNKLNEQFDTFRASLDSADALPTQQQSAVFDGLRGRLDDQLAKWQHIVQNAVPALNELMRKEGVPSLNLNIGVTSPDNAASHP